MGDSISHQPTELTPAELDAIRARQTQHSEINSPLLRAVLLEEDIPALLSHADALQAKVAHAKGAYSKMNEEVCQTLGAALGMPRFCDDQANFPGTTEADGVCVGEHVAETIAMEAARRIAELQAKAARLEGEYRRRRVDDELPENGETVVVGYGGCVSAFVLAKWSAGKWVVGGASFPRQDFDWWAPIPKGAAHVAPND